MILRLVWIGFMLWATTSAAWADDSAARITIAIKQISKMQSMALATCFAVGGLDAKRQSETALELADSYEAVLTALRDGHAWMGLNPAANPTEIQKLKDTALAWNRYAPAIRQLVAGDLHAVVLNQVIHGTDEATRIARGQASQFMVLHKDAVQNAELFPAVMMAGHLKMLTQRALFEMCWVQFDLGGQAKRDALAATLVEIENTAQILRQGEGEVRPPPNARIGRNLRTALLFWNKMRPTIDEVLTDTRPDGEAIAKMLRLNASVLKQMNQAIDGYLTS